MRPFQVSYAGTVIAVMIAAIAVLLVMSNSVYGSEPQHFWKGGYGSGYYPGKGPGNGGGGSSRASLTLVDGDFLTPLQPDTKTQTVTPGTPALYSVEVKCGTASGPVVGDCTWTGTYFDASGDGLVNYVVTCQLVKSCGRWGTGIVSIVGRAEGVDSEGFVQLAISGGVGSFANVKGVYTWEDSVGKFYFTK